MAKLIVELPDQMHEQLKRDALLHHRTIKDVITELVFRYLGEGRHKKREKESGLCGKWKDSRPPEAIIADIKNNRKWFKRTAKENG